MATKPKKETQSPTQVRVRMYRGILGDCFLLTFSNGDSHANALIDCGVLQGTSGAKQQMQDIANDIVKTCNGKLDLVVVTHEHADHLSGFVHAQDVFFGDQLVIDHVWFAWTEKDGDEQAEGLRRKFQKAKKAVVAGAKRANAMALAAADKNSEARDLSDILSGLASFIGEIDLGDGEFAAAGAATDKLRTTADVIGKLKTAGKKISYLEPADVLSTPGAVGVRTFVLGPPRDEKLLGKERPSSKDKETYLAEDSLLLDDLAGLALRGMPPPPSAASGDMSELKKPPAGADLPFRRAYNVRAEWVNDLATWGAELAEEDDTTGFKTAADWISQTYLDPESKWRQIDADWLGASADFALKLDSDTNNTSLVLAFELPTGDVLLFPGDAQVGNWLSWHTHKFKYKAGSQEKTCDAKDLLARTIFYKVGHHASHNATLRDLGLELMTHENLIAFIPVVQAVAEAQPSGWSMPFPELLSRLEEKAPQRVVRGDKDMPDSLGTLKGKKVKFRGKQERLHVDVVFTLGS